MNADLKTIIGAAVATAITAGMLGVMGLELQRSFDPTPAERTAVQMPRGASDRPDSGKPACC